MSGRQRKRTRATVRVPRAPPADPQPDDSVASPSVAEQSVPGFARRVVKRRPLISRAASPKESAVERGFPDRAGEQPMRDCAGGSEPEPKSYAQPVGTDARFR